MQRQGEQRKRALVETAAGLVVNRLAAPKAAALGQVIRQFYAHVPPDDVVARDAEDLYGAASSLWDFAAQRRPGHAKIRVFNPRPAEHGWRSGRTIVEIVNDDMPFLVDSVTAALNGIDLIVHLIIHPVLRLRRDGAGKIVELLDEAASDGAGSLRESLMHVEISEQNDPARREAIAARLLSVLDDVRHAVADWPAMRKALTATLDNLENRKLPMAAREVNEVAAFLRWLDEENFTFLGYREYRYRPTKTDDSVVVAKSGLGILRDDDYSVFDGLRHFAALPREVQDYLREPRLLTISKSNQRATVHRASFMDAIGVKIFDDEGEVLGEKLFIGLFTSLAYSRSPRAIPILRLKVQRTMTRAGFSPTSHDGKALQHILDTFPRDELLQIGEDDLFETALGILNLQERQRIALFLRRDPLERFVSCLVYVPRERYSTDLRRRVAAILAEACNGAIAGFTTQLDEAVLARVHFMIETVRGKVPAIDTAEIERRLAEAGRVWSDRLQEALIAAKGEDAALSLLQRYGNAFPTAYRENVPIADAVFDIDCLEAVRGGLPLGVKLYARGGGDPAALGLKIFHAGRPVALSDVLPMLENMGLKVIGEVPHAIALDGKSGAAWIQDIDLLARVSPEAADLAIAGIRPRFEDAFGRVSSGEMENDGLNRLVLAAGLSWHQVVILRLYAKVLRQAGSTFSQAYMEDALAAHPAIAGLLVALFERQFDPAAQARNGGTGDVADVEGIVAAIEQRLDDVANLDEDRILRSFLLLVRKSLRTNYYQRTPAGQAKPYLSVKLASLEIDLLPAPRPLVEIFVYSPRVEAIHLRGGKVARGGIRWSDRREDFRTEVLGLVKAQMVKNTVIVPVGSKGGFFVKKAPAGGDRDAQLAEGIACYRLFINGLLDITDNLVDGKVVNPHDVVRHDADDPYLVVAADKGTATFSDIANAISIEHNYWLGDAFASGGSHGYDHKGMGITAKGAWESVKRHFRALGRDCQSQDFTCVGIGDMSGDVFGNGMLLSEHIRLVAAFDHRHVFLDPNPDAARTFVERQRLFKVPRSSWDDYDKSLISAGGGVYPRSAKSIPVSPEVRVALGLKPDVEHLAPTDLLSAILKAPVDLLWNGGIGTYIKSSGETHAEVSDRANNGLRINGADVRAKIIGEGGNLGMTQKGRIEAAQKGVLLNTDFIDNSAGVDTSDHEVNIKILLNDAVQRGELGFDARNAQLAAMTDEVGQLVLWDNYRQNQAITLMEHQSVHRIGSMAHFIRTLEAEGTLDRQVENLPSEAELAERKSRGLGLTRPELAVLLSYDKMRLFQQLLDSDVPEDPYLSKELVRYFPTPLHEKYAAHMQRHRLKREIIATAVTNSTINRMGATFMMRMQEDTGQGPAAIAKAYTAAREILEARELWAEIEALDAKVAENTQIDAIKQIWSLLRHMTRWLLNRPGGSLDIAANVERYQAGVSALRKALPGVLTPTGKGDFSSSQEKWEGLGLPAELALRMARMPELRAALDMVEVSQQSGQPIEKVAGVFYELGEALDLEWLRDQIEALPVEGHWHAQARGSLLDELNHQHRALSLQVLNLGGGSKDVSPVQAWLQRDDATLQYTRGMLAEILTQNADYPIASVAVRRLAQLAQVPVG